MRWGGASGNPSDPPTGDEWRAGSSWQEMVSLAVSEFGEGALVTTSQVAGTPRVLALIS